MLGYGPEEGRHLRLGRGCSEAKLRTPNIRLGVGVPVGVYVTRRDGDNFGSARPAEPLRSTRRRRPQVWEQPKVGQVPLAHISVRDTGGDWRTRRSKSQSLEITQHPPWSAQYSKTGYSSSVGCLRCRALTNRAPPHDTIMITRESAGP